MRGLGYRFQNVSSTHCWSSDKPARRPACTKAHITDLSTPFRRASAPSGSNFPGRLGVFSAAPCPYPSEAMLFSPLQTAQTGTNCKRNGAMVGTDCGVEVAREQGRGSSLKYFCLPSPQPPAPSRSVGCRQPVRVVCFACDRNVCRGQGHGSSGAQPASKSPRAFYCQRTTTVPSVSCR